MLWTKIIMFVVLAHIAVKGVITNKLEGLDDNKPFKSKISPQHFLIVKNIEKAVKWIADKMNEENFEHEQEVEESISEEENEVDTIEEEDYEDEYYYYYGDSTDFTEPNEKTNDKQSDTKSGRKNGKTKSRMKRKKNGRKSGGNKLFLDIPFIFCLIILACCINRDFS
jgi:hypothetical protein